MTAAASNGGAQRLADIAWRSLALVCALGVICCYHWTLHSARAQMTPQKDLTDYYNRLVDGFQEGHLYMKAEVDPGLLALAPKDRPGNAPYLLDASLYDGHYYLYFGVVPAVLLHWPFVALTGLDLPDGLAVLALAAAALGASFLWWVELRRQLWPGLGAQLDWLAILVLGLGTGVPAVLRRPLFYEEATLAGWVFGALMLWALARAAGARGRAAGWLVAAGLACGLAVGSRANLVLAAVPVLAVGAWLAGRRFARPFRRGALPALELAAVGALVVGAGLAAYNHARFGSVLEFGHSHQIGHNPQQMFRASNLAHNLGRYYGLPPRLNAYFPYVLPAAETTKPEDYIGRESVHGEWVWLLAALAVVPGAGLLRRNPAASRLGPMALWLAGNLFVTGLLGVRANRYMLDFHPALVCLVLAVAAGITVQMRGRWLAWRWGLAGLMLVAVFFNVFASFQVHGFFAGTDPQGFKRLADLADRGVWRTVPWIFRSAGGLETGLRWPPAGPGGVMPLLATDPPELQDRLWVRLDGHGTAAFEWQHGDHGSVRGPAFAYQPGAKARLRMAGALLMPPPWHGWHGAHSEAEKIALRRRLQLWVDEALVFDRDVPSDPVAPWLVNWTALAEGAPRVFRADPAWAQNLAAQRGTVRLKLRLPLDRFGSTEPLVQTGADQSWDLVMVRFTRSGHVQVAHDSAGRGASASAEFAVDYTREQIVEVEMPAAQDGLAWNEQDTLQPATPLSLVVRWNGEKVMESSIVQHPTDRSSVAIGINDRASGCRASFAGELRAAPPLVPLADLGAAGWSCRLDPAETLLGTQGVLMHWRQADGRQAAVVWRRAKPEAPPQLGWLDNGQVEWAEAMPGPAAGELGLALAAGRIGEFAPFVLAWDGRTLLAGSTDFFARQPVEAYALSGGARKVAPQRTAAMASGLAASLPGRIRISMALPPGGLRQGAPVLSTGRTGRGDSIFLRPLGGDSYVVGVDHWGVAAHEGPPVTIVPARKFELTVEMGSLFEEGQFPAERVHVALNGSTVLEANVPLYRVPAAEVEFGRNTPGFSTSGERFPGEIFSVRRQVP